MVKSIRLISGSKPDYFSNLIEETVAAENGKFLLKQQKVARHLLKACKALNEEKEKMIVK